MIRDNTIYIKSSETKPIDGIENGTALYEVDTKDIYIFYDGEWVKQ